ncbi:MAG TPA: proline iminopeptidase-family hydrolase [Candidatus Babeliales bacterium]|nr:proline iminopeptidase-family hydrolase [Candidatus Babeliales bacterium]
MTSLLNGLNWTKKFFSLKLTVAIILTIIPEIGLSHMEPLQLQQHYLDFEYCTLWAQTWFTSQTKHKTPIIFIHGGPGLESGYIINLKQLAYNQPCIFYDQSGCGKSLLKDDICIQWTLEHYVDEFTILIDRLNLDKIILFGYSWGAAIATSYTLKNESHVEKLILASPYISTPHLIENYKQLAQSKNIYEIIHTNEYNGTLDNLEYQTVCSVFFKNFIFSKDSSIFNTLTFNKKISNEMWGPNEFSATGNLINLNLIPLLHTLQLPVLLTAGRLDTMTPEYMQLLHKKIPNSRLIIFEHSTHMPHREEEDAYCAALYKEI